jgi:hypothetical protein
VFRPGYREFQLPGKEIANPNIEGRPEETSDGIQGEEAHEGDSFGARKGRHEAIQSREELSHT